MLDVSVIIVSFNTIKLTLGAVNSVLNDKSKISKEVIIVDNASSDGSQKELSKLEKQRKIRLIKNKRNLGFSSANNQGLKISKGKHKLLLNSDAQLQKGCMEKIIEFAEMSGDAGVVAPRLLNPDGSVQASCFRLPTLTRALRQYWLGEKNILDKYILLKENRGTIAKSLRA